MTTVRAQVDNGMVNYNVEQSIDISIEARIYELEVVMFEAKREIEALKNIKNKSDMLEYNEPKKEL